MCCKENLHSTKKIQIYLFSQNLNVCFQFKRPLEEKREHGRSREMEKKLSINTFGMSIYVHAHINSRYITLRYPRCKKVKKIHIAFELLRNIFKNSNDSRKCLIKSYFTII